jgi:transketolase
MKCKRGARRSACKKAIAWRSRERLCRFLKRLEGTRKDVHMDSTHPTAGGDGGGMSAEDIAQLERICRHLRTSIINTVADARAGHTGGSLSEVEILAALYFRVLNIDPSRPDWPQRDRFILSKGHASPGYYCTLAYRGYFAEEKLAQFDAVDSMLQGHPSRLHTPGVDMSTGSLGQGLSAAAGMAIGRDYLAMQFQVYVLLGDGELQEGQVWEAAMFAGAHRLTGLVAIVDLNGVQLSGTVADTLPLEPLADKWRAFGWQVLECEGHDVAAVAGTLEQARRLSAAGPVAVIAHTVKGKGVSFMEGKYQWHARVLNEDERRQALAEIERAAR